MSVRERILLEAGRCIYCGFCEAVCPTLPHGPHRGYGPRGRVNIALRLARGDTGWTRSVEESLYTCLLCGACNLKCPAGIDIPLVVRLARTLRWTAETVRGRKREPVAAQAAQVG